jgi:hypothetical protein
VILARLGKLADGRATWAAQCDCSQVVEVTASILQRKVTPVRSCGCLRREQAARARLLSVTVRSRVWSDAGRTKVRATSANTIARLGRGPDGRILASAALLVTELPKHPGGRPRIYADGAARVRAFRERQRALKNH